MQRYAPLEVRQQLGRRKRHIDAAKANPIAMEKIANKEAFLADASKIENTIKEITPPDTTGEQKDKLKVRLNALTEAVTVGDPGNGIPRMISDSEAWQNGASAPGNLLRWENFWGNHTLNEEGNVVQTERGKGAKWEIKDLRRMIYKDEESDNPDVASLENIRPRFGQEPLADVPRRSYGLSPQAKAQYDQVFPDHTQTDVEAKLQASAKKRKEVNREAASKRMKAWHAARRAQKKALAEQRDNAAVS